MNGISEQASQALAGWRGPRQAKTPAPTRATLTARSAVRRRVAVALILFSVCGLTVIRLPLAAFREYRTSTEPDTASVFLARYARLKPYLSAPQRLDDELVGYVPDFGSIDEDRMTIGGRVSLAQYALSSVVVKKTRAAPLVIFESDDPARIPARAVGEDWTLVADIGNGLKLYRTPSRD